jgi:hypothetical protein
MRIILILVGFVLFSVGCKKCEVCEDTFTGTSSVPREGYPKNFRDTIEFCGYERRQAPIYSNSTHKYGFGPGDTVTHYFSRNCWPKK